jgi:hypothetical protein
MFPVELAQTGVGPEIVGTGNGLTTIVGVPVIKTELQSPLEAKTKNKLLPKGRAEFGTVKEIALPVPFKGAPIGLEISGNVPLYN